MTIGAADIDSVDGLAHVRFVLAPVLQDPGHNPNEQPYFFVQLTNLTKGNAVLYQDFNFANQPGVPWKNDATGTIRYTDWTLVDIAPGSATLAPNDEVELEVIAGGCSLGGHWGHVYVDGAGTGVPSLFVAATGPSAANQNTDITYTLTYKNGGNADAGGTLVTFNTPPFTTFSSFNAPGLTCTAPAAGATGTVSCAVGTLPAGGSGSFTVTTHINNGTAGNVITAGNYDISGTGVSPLLGPKVYTTITNNVAYANVGVAFQSGASTVAAGGTVTYVIEVTNAGPNAVNGATVTDNLPAQLTGASWTCAGSGGATCAASGSGSINDAATSIPVGGKLTYTVTATVDPAAAAGQLANVASVSVPGGASDPDPSNNSVGDYKQITVANGVTCATAVDCTSGVCNAGDLKCGYPDDGGPCTLGNGALVCRSGACSFGGTCMPLGGCNVDADCSSGNWCSVSTHTCTAKVANGGDIPTDPAHTAPTLDGTCTVDAANVTCLSSVCDTADDKCGYADGDGTCTTADAAVVCRSGSCSTNGVCKAAEGCNVDADCSSGWCNITAHTCSAKVVNGGAVPTDAAHTSPTLDGTCTADAATLTCASAVCDTADSKCGYADGNGTCTSANAGVVCRSGSCSSTGVCKAATACNTDQDCNVASEFCNTASHACTAKLPNGTSVPAVAGHTPSLDGTCTAEVGTIVCQSQVCDPTDNKCGYGNGDGPCTTANGAAVCRAGVCDADGKCGLPDGKGPCSSDSACRASTCNLTTHTCGTPATATGCKTDAECPVDAFCALSGNGGTCTPKQDDGTTCAGANQCKSGACNEALCDSPYAVGAGIGCAVGPSGSSDAGPGAGTFGLAFVAASFVRRRRREARIDR